MNLKKDKKQFNIFAIIQVGDKQYRVQQEDCIVIPLKKKYNIGTILNVNKILLLANSKHTIIGQPLIKGISISIRILDILPKKHALAQIIQISI